MPFNAVHAPHQVPDEYTKPYDNLKGTRKTYAGMLAAMDEAIGKILKAIDDNGLRKNTLIVFHSDNGGPSPGKVTDNGSLRARQREPSTKAAFACVRWPRGKGTSNRVVSSINRCTSSICTPRC